MRAPIEMISTVARILPCLKLNVTRIQVGAPLPILKEPDGWQRIEMAQKHAHLAPTHLAAHGETVTFWSQQTLKKKQPPLLAAVGA